MQWIARASRTHLAIVFVALVTFILCFTYLNSLDATVEVAQLKRDVFSGAKISDNDIKFVSVPKNEITYKHLISKKQLTRTTYLAKTDLEQSDLLTISNTSKRKVSPSYQSLSIGIEQHKANGGDLEKGDRIDIWTTGESSRLVTTNVSIRNIIKSNKKLGTSSNQLVTIVVAVSPEEARALSRVIGSDDLMIVLSNGAPSDTLPIDGGSEENEPFISTELAED